MAPELARSPPQIVTHLVRQAVPASPTALTSTQTTPLPPKVEHVSDHDVLAVMTKKNHTRRMMMIVELEAVPLDAPGTAREAERTTTEEKEETALPRDLTDPAGP